MSRLRFPSRAATGAYPERRDKLPGTLERTIDPVYGWFLRRLNVLETRKRKPFLRAVHRHAAELEGIGANAIVEHAARLRYQLRSEGPRPERVAAAFALVREVATQTLGMRHYDAQLIGGWTMLNGFIAEMQTGEGKTLTATLPTATVALAGLPVHVVTVNDYLAGRDAELMRPVYETLGLSLGVVREGMPDAERRAAYGCDITYCTNKQLTFDYLRDRMVLGSRPGRLRIRAQRLSREEPVGERLLLRGLCYVLVDEADSVLIDEARTPLILSADGAETESREVYQAALDIAGALVEGADYKLKIQERHLELTDRGRRRLRALALEQAAPWRSPRRGEELVNQALVAQHLFQRDQHYLLRDGKVEIIDEFTGRTMADRSWEHGLHQMIETREGCELSNERRTLARMSYQRFFRRYLRLSGMTGTGSEAAAELWSVYRLRILRVPTHRPVQRRRLRTRVVGTTAEKWALVVERARQAHAEGRPVLIGTRSVEASEQVSAALEAAGLSCAVLNARQDATEAEIVAEAGLPGRITVATNMAGRGTDIKLADGVAERGGLHVILTERHDAGRIDRQLQGRCGRQGDPGSFEAVLCMEDELVVKWTGRGALGATLRSAALRTLGYRAEWLFSAAQRSIEGRHGKMRRELLGTDADTDRMLAFAGAPE